MQRLNCGCLRCSVPGWEYIGFEVHVLHRGGVESGTRSYHWQKMQVEEDSPGEVGEFTCAGRRDAQYSESLWNEAREIRSRIEGTSKLAL